MQNRIKLCVKQGEEFNRAFTIYSGDNPLDLTNYTIKFTVKSVPLAKAKSLIDKEITTSSDINTVGRINYPLQGKFFVHLSKEDTSLPIGDYTLDISLNSDHFSDIISSTCCTSAIYRVCEL